MNTVASLLSASFDAKGKLRTPSSKMITESENICSAKFRKLVVMRRPSVKWVRSDGGCEYLYNPFAVLAAKRSIVHEITTPYSAESNRKSECLNRTLIDMAQCMMLNAHFQKANWLWTEAINTANYLRNRLYTKSCM